MIGQGDIVSAEPAKRIVQMGRLVASDSGRLELLASGDMAGVEGHRELTAEVEAYLAKFGDRCAEEIKLESHTLREDPAILLKAIAAAARSKSSARSVRRPSAKQQLRALFPHRPLKRGLAAWVLAVAKARVRDRENLRFERTRVFARARDIFLAIGNQLHAVGAIDDPRDVFFLTVSEVLGAIEGCAVTGDLHGLITLRKSELEGAALRDAPPKRICVRGAALLVARDSFATGPKATSETLREGTACSAGTVRGRARIVKDPRRDSLESGEILIASHTDPGWIALFANAAAIVVERGSLLSHSAIVARELGIPCVVGLESATEWLQTGDAIEVNGATGTVRKVHA
jgi:pyruvate,water dikinase